MPEHTERIKELRKELREFNEPRYQELNIYLLEYWGLGYSIPQIAEEFEYKESTVKAKLTTLGIDWRNSELPQHEPELKLIY